jgi:hypothetical protein
MIVASYVNAMHTSKKNRVGNLATLKWLVKFHCLAWTMKIFLGSKDNEDFGRSLIVVALGQLFE